MDLLKLNNMSTKVKNYTDNELLQLVSELPSFTGFPKAYWVLGVQSNEDTYNSFDDKIYLFHNKTFIAVSTGTTNAGSDSLMNFTKEKLSGALVWKTNEWYYDFWSSKSWDKKSKYLHKGKMKALRQDKPNKIFRDSNKNTKVEQLGKQYIGIYGCNFHLNTYNTVWNKVKNWLIGGWSWGCVVLNDPDKYYNEFLSRLYEQEYTTYVILQEK